MARRTKNQPFIHSLLNSPWVSRLLAFTTIVSLGFNVVLGLSWLQQRKQPKLATGNTVTVANVVDGDTFDTKDGIRVRLLGIDAPEYPEGCLSKRAKERLSALVLGKDVALEVTGQDRFGRKTAWGLIGGDVPLSIVLVEEGLATADTTVEGDRGALLVQAESRAQETLRGIWGNECTSKQEGCVIKGNYHKGTKERTYHSPGCYNYNQISINPNESDRWFCTEKEAEAAGFVKSRDCPGEK